MNATRDNKELSSPARPPESAAPRLFAVIDLGATAYKKVEVPASWANAVDAPKADTVTGRPATVKMVKDIMQPVGKMDGDSLPVSAFVDHADGTFELGAAAYEKRGVSVMVPEWTAATCATALKSWKAA